MKTADKANKRSRQLRDKTVVEFLVALGVEVEDDIAFQETAKVMDCSVERVHEALDAIMEDKTHLYWSDK